MTAEDDREGTDNVHRLDTRQAELGAGLRRLFRPLIDEPVPPELARLSAELEARFSASPEEQDGDEIRPPPHPR
ncbi:hypothetical protein [Chthonobacter albigriseus]|uniref:hypothetical protein n=1 Tax=Chthonobacter albigriseus TaxID=1683161 RepID=UPI0015EE94BE|nr:hypothetical protein [Chthonobacter albigriseus]